MKESVLTFDEPTHVYELDGRQIPSVTQVLEPFSGMEFVDPIILKAASDFGTNVHIACDLFNNECLDWDQLDPALVPYVEAWDKCLRDTGAVVLKSEMRVFSSRLKCAGTLDDVVYLRNGECMYDIKSTAGVPRTVGPQTAAYAEFYKEMTGKRIKRRYCCHLKPDGRYALVELKEHSDWPIFQACLTLFRKGWIKARKRA